VPGGEVRPRQAAVEFRRDGRSAAHRHPRPRGPFPAGAGEPCNPPRLEGKPGPAGAVGTPSKPMGGKFCRGHRACAEGDVGLAPTAWRPGGCRPVAPARVSGLWPLAVFMPGACRRHRRSLGPRSSSPGGQRVAGIGSEADLAGLSPRRHSPFRPALGAGLAIEFPPLNDEAMNRRAAPESWLAPPCSSPWAWATLRLACGESGVQARAYPLAWVSRRSFWYRGRRGGRSCRAHRRRGKLAVKCVGVRQRLDETLSRVTKVEGAANWKSLAIRVEEGGLARRTIGNGAGSLHLCRCGATGKTSGGEVCPAPPSPPSNPPRSSGASTKGDRKETRARTGESPSP